VFFHVTHSEDVESLLRVLIEHGRDIVIRARRIARSTRTVASWRIDPCDATTAAIPVQDRDCVLMPSASRIQDLNRKERMDVPSPQCIAWLYNESLTTYLYKHAAVLAPTRHSGKSPSECSTRLLRLTCHNKRQISRRKRERGRERIRASGPQPGRSGGRFQTTLSTNRWRSSCAAI